MMELIETVKKSVNMCEMNFVITHKYQSIQARRRDFFFEDSFFLNHQLTRTEREK